MKNKNRKIERGIGKVTNTNQKKGTNENNKH